MQQTPAAECDQMRTLRSACAVPCRCNPNMHRTGTCLYQQTPGIKRIPSFTCTPACSLPRRRHLHLYTQSCKLPQTGLYQHMACRSCSRRSRQTPTIVRAYGSEGGTDAQTSSTSAQTTGSTLIQRELVLFIIQQVHPASFQQLGPCLCEGTCWSAQFSHALQLTSLHNLQLRTGREARHLRFASACNAGL